MYQPDPEVVRDAIYSAVSDFLNQQFITRSMGEILYKAVKDGINESADWVFTSFENRKVWAVDLIEALGR